MNLKLSTVEDLADARALGPLLQSAAEESGRSYREDPLPAVAAERFLDRAFGRPETLLLVARTAEGEPPVALVATGPLTDPLSGESLPVVVALWVAPDLRHRGLARALVREARRRLAARGLERLAVRVSYNDDALISMGERWGFVRAWELMTLE